MQFLDWKDFCHESLQDKNSASDSLWATLYRQEENQIEFLGCAAILAAVQPLNQGTVKFFVMLCCCSLFIFFNKSFDLETLNSGF